MELTAQAQAPVGWSWGSSDGMWIWNGERWVPSDAQAYMRAQGLQQPESPVSEAEEQSLAELRAQTKALRLIQYNVSTLTILAILAFISSIIGGAAIGLLIAAANKSQQFPPCHSRQLHRIPVAVTVELAGMT